MDGFHNLTRLFPAASDACSDLTMEEQTFILRNGGGTVTVGEYFPPGEKEYVNRSPLPPIKKRGGGGVGGGGGTK